jgi:hypothetical protein
MLPSDEKVLQIGQRPGVLGEVIPISIAIIDHPHAMVIGVANFLDHPVFPLIPKVMRWLVVDFIANL